MFDCRGCAAKDLIIAKLEALLERSLKANEAANDRFQALTGTLSEVANARDMQTAATPQTAGPAAEPDLTDEEWERQELDKTIARVERKFGKIQPDFPA